jgi:hypothetical protein
VRAGLVGDEIGPCARIAALCSLQQLQKDLRGIAEQADRNRRATTMRRGDRLQRLVERAGALIEVARAQTHLDARGIAFDGEHRGAGHRRGQRLRAPHAAEPAGENPLAGEASAIVLAPGLGEGLVGPLNDALAADVDPRARGHLTEHHQTLAVERVEVLPRRPVRYQIGVRDQHARRVGVRAEHANRFAGLDQQALVFAERLQRIDDRVEARPVARGAADAAVDDQLLRLFGNLGIEVVHQHAQRRLGRPGSRLQLVSARCAYDAARTPACGGVQSRIVHGDLLVLLSARSGTPPAVL